MLHNPVASHLSLTVQCNPSSQGVLTGLGSAKHVFKSSSQTPVVHSPFWGEQSRVTPPVHWPFEQDSLTVQNSPSSQPLPLLAGRTTHVSVFSSHTPSAHCVSNELQSRGSETLHKPVALHLSLTVQCKLSSQGVLTGLGCASQVSVDSLHTPVVHGPFCAVQSRVIPPVHWPFEQDSLTVQNIPSSQPLPLLADWATHVSVFSSQTPSAHCVSSELQSGGVPDWQPIVAEHVSAPLQKSPSSQAPF